MGLLDRLLGRKRPSSPPSEPAPPPSESRKASTEEEKLDQRMRDAFEKHEAAMTALEEDNQSFEELIREIEREKERGSRAMRGKPK